MNQSREEELFEAELRRIKPAPLRPEFRERLIKSQPVSVQKVFAPQGGRLTARQWLKGWVLPFATACFLVLAITWQVRRSGQAPAVLPANSVPGTTVAGTRLNADEVVIDRELMAAFDTVAQLPSGEPVRFRCREWSEKVLFRDRGKGISVERSQPRFEAIPIEVEIY